MLVADQATLSKIARENIAKESRLHTDESRPLRFAAGHFGAHKTVHHSSASTSI